MAVVFSTVTREQAGSGAGTRTGTPPAWGTVTEVSMSRLVCIPALATLALIINCGSDEFSAAQSTDARNTSSSALVRGARGDGGYGGEKITICHATGSETNPYVEITISVSALPAHENHQNQEDIIPAPANGCPGAEECNCECACDKWDDCR